ncbi:hypothetical protein [Virgibacillus oceani]|uniref:Uncharacterized protein n=1 Tax=Virgibacillus oceani TaxID=1479511 RepID=A0A917HB21_9BACI|nr:hypothetical protein [Virgibacillus oceani]GGG72806.1 hypothetical protein GCM10011398_16500 [Virgibacillus oceani]
MKLIRHGSNAFPLHVQNFAPALNVTAGLSMISLLELCTSLINRSKPRLDREPISSGDWLYYDYKMMQLL